MASLIEQGLDNRTETTTGADVRGARLPARRLSVAPMMDWTEEGWFS
jgi:hypothetical protein